MRTLTIKRNKTFVACLGKFKVYIEDATNNDLLINDTPCRLLGSLKNNEEKTFVIGNESAKVFVIAGKMSKGFCNEFYQLPAGEEPVFLSGKPKFNPASGNAFRFDNNDSEEVLQNRKKGSRKGLIILIGALIIGVIAGTILGKFIGRALFSGKESTEKSFTSNGMSITLTDAFKEMEEGNYAAAYSANRVAVFAIEEPLQYFENGKNMTVTQYGNLVITNNGVENAALKTKGNLTYFDYEAENTEVNKTFHYRAYLFKTADAFWMVQFATETKHFGQYERQIADWAKSITFNK